MAKFVKMIRTISAFSFVIAAALFLSSCTIIDDKIIPMNFNEVKIPVFQDQILAENFVEDHSVEVTLSEKQNVALNEFISETFPDGPDSGYYAKDFRTHEAYKLPDGTFFITGRFNDYLAPSWMLHMTATGGYITSYDAGGTFLGYADGYAFLRSSFGDGGGLIQQIDALEINTQQITGIYGEDSMLANIYRGDPAYIPINCVVPTLEDPNLTRDIKEIAQKYTWKISEMRIGTPCYRDEVLTIPFAVPSKAAYGVSLRLRKEELIIRVDTDKDDMVYPPIYDASSSEINDSLVYISSHTASGTYIYDQTHYWDNSDNGEISIRAYVSVKENIDFCRTHSCVENVRIFLENAKNYR